MKQAFIKRQKYDRNYLYLLIEGRPENFKSAGDDERSARLIGTHSTRREAIRHGKRDGYDIIIKNRAAEQDKKSLLGNLATAKQRVASQQATTQAATVSKSKPSGLEM
ncbi:MAG: hypothetical protein FWB92_13140 [Oscillospiraceae bacterium]|nr:hypothetical protein [Oscillospiraceae bacterium]